MKQKRGRSSIPAGRRSELYGMRYADDPERRGLCSPGAGVHSRYMQGERILQPELRMPILQGGAQRYRKNCDQKVSGAGCPGRERLCLGIHRCMDHVPEVCMPMGFPFTGRRKSRSSMGPDSRTTLANWIIYCSQNYCMITFTADF